jgi:hypothetical protein
MTRFERAGSAALAAVLALMMSACGGGGGSPSVIDGGGGGGGGGGGDGELPDPDTAPPLKDELAVRYATVNYPVGAAIERPRTP